MAATRYDPEFWCHPVRDFSVGTCIVQRVILLAALVAMCLRKKLFSENFSRTKKGT